MESLRDPARAVRLAEKAGALDESYLTVRTLGAAQYRVGNDRAAVASLELVPRLSSPTTTLMPYGQNPPEYLFFRAMARYRLDDPEAARRDYDEAVRLMPWHDHNWSELQQFRAEAAALLGVP